MKFILILHLCSFAGPLHCDNGAIIGEYKDWKDCSIAGYEFSAQSMTGYPRDLINKDKLAIKFECKQLGEI